VQENKSSYKMTTFNEEGNDIAYLILTLLLVPMRLLSVLLLEFGRMLDATLLALLSISFFLARLSLALCSLATTAAESRLCLFTTFLVSRFACLFLPAPLFVDSLQHQWFGSLTDFNTI
jgi:hypothetical protein